MYHPRTHTLLKNKLRKQDGLDQDFVLRTAANLDTIDGLFRKLYGHREDVHTQCSALLDAMIDCYQRRPEKLRELDLQRENDPAWFLSQKWVGMMLYTDLFSGNLRDLNEKISYFDELGINLVHLMPLMKCPPKNNDGGYAVSDYRKVNPDLGNLDDLKNVADTFTQKDILLMLDLALNHTSNEHEWARKALEGESKFQDFYYMYDSRDLPDQFERSMPEVFPETSPGNFTYQPDIKKWVMTVFHEYQWDLNYTNPVVFIGMLENLLFLANLGVDIIRLDALAFMWKRIGTTCQNLDEAHLLIQLFKACAQVVAPGTLFLAEAIVAPDEIIKYFGQIREGISNECDLAYNATLMTLLWESTTTKNNRLLTVSLNNIPQKPYGATWLNYLRCHDDIGLGYEDLHASWAGYDAPAHRRFITQFLCGDLDISFSRGARFMEDKRNGNARISGSLASLAGLESGVEQNDQKRIDEAIQRIIMLHAIILSYGGIPLLYMGDELGMTNDYTYLDNPGKRYDNRWMHRPSMDWVKYKLREDKKTVEGRIYQSLKKLIARRKEISEFADKANRALVDPRNEHLLTFLRFSDSGRSLCVFNLNDHPEPLYRDVIMEIGMDISNLNDLASGKELDLQHGNLILPPYHFMWIANTPKSQ